MIDPLILVVFSAMLISCIIAYFVTNINTKATGIDPLLVATISYKAQVRLLLGDDKVAELDKLGIGESAGQYTYMCFWNSLTPEQCADNIKIQLAKVKQK